MIVHLTIKEIVLMQSALRCYCFYEQKCYDLLEAAGSEAVLAETDDNIKKGSALVGLLDDVLSGVENITYAK